MKLVSDNSLTLNGQYSGQYFQRRQCAWVTAADQLSLHLNSVAAQFISLTHVSVSKEPKEVLQYASAYSKQVNGSYSTYCQAKVIPHFFWALQQSLLWKMQYKEIYCHL